LYLSSATSSFLLYVLPQFASMKKMLVLFFNVPNFPRNKHFFYRETPEKEEKNKQGNDKKKKT